MLFCCKLKKKKKSFEYLRYLGLYGSILVILECKMQELETSRIGEMDKAFQNPGPNIKDNNCQIL